MTRTLPGGLRWSDLVVIAVATAVGLALVVGYALMSGTKYASTALVNGGPGSSASLPLDLSSDVTQRYVATELIYIDTLSDEIAANMTAATGLTDPPSVQSNQDGSTNVIKMTVVGSSPEQAAQLAEVAADTYITNWRERTLKDPDRQELAAVKSDRYVQHATPAAATKTTSTITLGVVGLILGFAAGVLITYLRVRGRHAGGSADG